MKVAKKEHAIHVRIAECFKRLLFNFLIQGTNQTTIVVTEYFPKNSQIYNTDICFN